MVRRCGEINRADAVRVICKHHYRTGRIVGGTKHYPAVKWHNGRIAIVSRNDIRYCPKMAHRPAMDYNQSQ